MLSSITIFVVGVAAGVYLVGRSKWDTAKEIAELKTRNRKMVELLQKMKEDRNNRMAQYSDLLDICNELKALGADHSLIKEAARAAMLASHPDRSGKDTTKEFIKFKGLYDKFK